MPQGFGGTTETLTIFGQTVDISHWSKKEKEDETT